jgi:hypothetical protein
MMRPSIEGNGRIMLGIKTRHFAPIHGVTLESLVPADHFYRQLESAPGACRSAGTGRSGPFNALRRGVVQQRR